MRNLKIWLSYRGTAYHGFQRQDNALSIQQVLEDTYASITGEKSVVHGCSRTDAGVHALQFCAHIHSSSPIPCERLKYAWNNLLPSDIAIHSCTQAADDFHARFDCKGKEYVYRIYDGAQKEPFLSDRALWYPYPLDAEKMDQAARQIEGTHDFAAFCATGSSVRGTVRTVYSCACVRQGECVEVTVRGNGFLYNMVRIIAGTLLYVNEGKIDAGKIPQMLAAKDRTLAGKTLPPHGLYLRRVFYDDTVSSPAVTERK